MSQRRHHYEQALEAYLREQRVPFVSVNEARRALWGHEPGTPLNPRRRLEAGTPHKGNGQDAGIELLEDEPASARTELDRAGGSSIARPVDGPGARLRPHSDGLGRDAPSLKSFDLVLYGEGPGLLVDVKGRRIGMSRSRRPSASDRMITAASPGGVGGGVGVGRSARTRLETWVTQDDVDSLRHWQRLFGPEFRAAFVFVYWCDEQPASALFEEIFEFRGRWYAVRAVLLEDYVQRMRTRSPRWRTVHVPSALFDQISGPLLDRSQPPGS